MEDFLAIIAANYVPVAVTLGVIVCLAGVLRMLFSRTFAWSGLAVIFLGGILAAIPLISKASLGKDGFEIVTNLNQTTEKLNDAIKANGDAIASLREGLSAVETLIRESVTNGSTTSTVSPGLSRDALEAFTRSLDESRSELLNIEAATGRVDEQLRMNDALIQQFER